MSARTLFADIYVGKRADEYVGADCFADIIVGD